MSTPVLLLIAVAMVREHRCRLGEDIWQGEKNMSIESSFLESRVTLQGSPIESTNIV